MGLSAFFSSRLAKPLVLGLAAAALATATLQVRTDTHLEGRDEASLAGQATAEAAVEAYFLRESYRPGSWATLVYTGPTTGLSMQIFRSGSEPDGRLQRDKLYGVAVTSPVRLASTGPSTAQRRAAVSIGNWPSGFYYAQLVTPNGEIGYAPFIVRPRALGEHRVAVVLPTNTWQAYNRRDADDDGTGDTWYENWGIESVDLTRAFLDRGVPPNFGRYDRPFLRWLESTGKEVDLLSDRDLDTVGSGDELARAYDLIVFPGHHEYVTTHEYDVVERFRDLGGNLMFLSANNFFWQVIKHGDTMTRTKQWRDLGRPESALIGVQYVANDRGLRRGSYAIRRSTAAGWVFAGLPHEPGTAFGNSFGIEIDATTPASPRGTEVLAEIPHLFGPGRTAQMSYYETDAGARVFAAGAFTLAGSALSPAVSQLLENVWARLSSD